MLTGVSNSVLAEVPEGERVAAAGVPGRGVETATTGRLPAAPGGAGPSAPGTTHDEGADPDRVRDIVFDIAKGDVDLQFKIAERFDAKARATFAISAGLFTAAQAVALRQDVLDALTKHE